MASPNRVIAKIESAEGFYIGDVCYVLDPKFYAITWGGVHNYEDGCFTDHAKKRQFAVAGTAWGNGNYSDNFGNAYPVDVGVIGLVPLELVCDDKPEATGTVIREPGVACFEAEKGKFKITTPAGKVYIIDTFRDNVDEL